MQDRSETAANAADADVGSALYLIDARRSRFTVQAFAAGMLSAMGHNPTIGVRTFSGQARFNPEAVEAEGFSLRVDSASLSVEDDISDKDRREIERIMKNEVLEVEKYPEIRYDAPSIGVKKIDGAMFSATLNGSLSLHGVVRTESIQVRILTMGEMLRASGEFMLSQANYQIRPVSVAGGALKLKDELKFSFEMLANKQ